MHSGFESTERWDAGGAAIDWETVERARHGYEPVLPKERVQQGDYRGLAKRLMHAVIITTYNKWVYFHQRVDWDARLKDKFETDTLANKRGRGAEVEEGEIAHQAGSGTKTQEQAQYKKGMLQAHRIIVSIGLGKCLPQLLPAPMLENVMASELHFDGEHPQQHVNGTLSCQAQVQSPAEELQDVWDGNGVFMQLIYSCMPARLQAEDTKASI